MLNFFKLYFGHYKSSKRVLLVASIGFICALTIVSSTNYYFDNSKVLLIEDYISSNPTLKDAPDINVYLTGEPSHYDQSINSIKTITNITKSEFGINYFKSVNITSLLSGLSIPIYQSGTNVSLRYNYSVQVTDLKEPYLSELKDLNSKNSLINISRIPLSDSSIPQVYVLFLGEYYQTPQINLTNNRLVNMYDCENCRGGNSYQVNVTGVGLLNTKSLSCNINGTCVKNLDYNKYPNILKLSFFNSYYTSQVIVFTSNLNQISEILKPITSKGSQSYYSTKFYYSISIIFDYTKIDPYNSGAIITQINYFDARLSDNLYNTNDFQSIGVNFNAQDTFQSIADNLTNLMFALIIVSLPILIATILVINYSFGLIRKKIVRNIGIYKSRGSSSIMLFYFLLIDNVIIILFSVIVAIFTGIPLSIFVLKTDYLLSFNYSAPTYYILNFRAIASLLIYVAFIISLLTNSRRVKRLSQMPIVETEKPSEKEEPLWKKYYFDIIISLFGIIMYGILFVLTNNSGIAYLIEPVIPILLILAVPSPFLLVLGLILITNRIIPEVLNKISIRLWKDQGNLLAYSFKNIVRHKQASTRAIVLIGILIAFIVFFYTLPYSSIYNNEINFYYQNGAEGVGSFGNAGYNDTSMKIIQNNFSQYLVSYSPYIIISGTSGSTDYAIMLVNTSTYLKSAYLNFNLGLTKNINNDFNDLIIKNTSDPSTLNVLVEKNSLSERKGSIDSNLIIPNENNSLKLHVIDSFKNWPMLKYMFQHNIITLGIGDINYYLSSINRNLKLSPLSNVISQGIFFNFKEGIDQSLVAKWIQGNTSLVKLTLESEANNAFHQSAQFRLQVGQINNNILMVLIISIIVLIMFSYFQLNERKKDLYTERCLGMKLSQIASLFLIETSIIIVTSILLGVILGIFLMNLLAFLLLNPSQNYPPYILVYPLGLITVSILLILLCSIISSIIPTYYVKTQDISISFIDT